MSWWNKLVSFFKPLPADELPNPLKDEAEVETEMVRARNKKGRYMADDPTTPDVNEAYTTIKVKKSKK
jgi:hypothetical protein